MAILQKGDGAYLKIDYDKCMICSETVFVGYTIYDTQTEREKEKQRQPKFVDFYSRLSAAEADAVSRAAALAETKGISKDAPDLAQALPEIAAVTDLWRRVYSYIDRAGASFYGDAATDLPSIDADVGELLEACGYSEQWVKNPIKTRGGCVVNCGGYDYLPLCPAYFYGRLKTAFHASDIADV